MGLSPFRSAYLQLPDESIRRTCLARNARADAGVGFGTKKPPKPATKEKKQRQSKPVSISADDESAVQQAIRLAGGSAAPIDEEQASRGRVDVAKVKDWGAGRPKELESLQLESFSAGGGSQQQQQQNFYVQLTYAVAQATEQGRVNKILYDELPVRGRKKLPEFSDWSLSKPHYSQYLVDQQHVHHVLELSVAEALAVNQESRGVAAALDCFSEARGLDRSLEIATDLTNMAADAQPGGPATPTAAARSYAEYIGSVGRSGAEAATLEERNDACLRLLAHAYTNHMLLLTRGSIVGRNVANRLDLFKSNAVHTYRSYPFERMGKDPFEALKRNVNEAGEALSEAEREAVKKELPLAMAHTIQLWEALAHTE